MSTESFEIPNQSLKDSATSTEEWHYEGFQSIELHSLNNQIEPSTELRIDSVMNLSFGEDDNFSNNINQNYKIRRGESLMKELRDCSNEKEGQEKDVLPLIEDNQRLLIKPTAVEEALIKGEVLAHLNEAEEKEKRDNSIKEDDAKVVSDPVFIEALNIKQNDIEEKKDDTRNRGTIEEMKAPVMAIEEEKTTNKKEISVEDDNSQRIDTSTTKIINELTEKLIKVEKRYNIIHDSNNELLEVINNFKQIQLMKTSPTPNTQELNEAFTQKNIKRANSEGKIKLSVDPRASRPRLYIDLVQTNSKTYSEIHGKENQKNADNTLANAKNHCKGGLYEESCRNKGVIQQLIYSHKRPQLKRMNLNAVNVPQHTANAKKRIDSFQERDCENEENSSSWYNNTNSFKQLCSNRIAMDETMPPKDYHTLGQGYPNAMNNCCPDITLEEYFRKPVNEIRRFPSFQWNHDKMTHQFHLQPDDKKTIDNDTLNSPYCRIKPISLSNLTKKTNAVENPTSLTSKSKHYVDFKRFQVIFDDDHTKANTNSNHIITDSKVNDMNQTTKEASSSCLSNAKTLTDNNSRQKPLVSDQSVTIPFYLLNKRELMLNVVSSLCERPKKIAYYHQRKPSKKSTTELSSKQSSSNK